jgi:hypothetical protein
VRSEDIQLLRALTGPVDELHMRVLTKVTAVPNQVGRPDAAWSQQTWWNRTVAKLVASQHLEQVAAAALQSQLGVLVSALEDADSEARIQGLDRAAHHRLMIEAAAGARRAWSVRAKRIAVTETTRLLSERAMTGAGAGAMKLWQSEHDDKVRPSHREADNNTPIPLSMPFMVGGWPMMHPGDPDAPADEVVNCRCELKIVKGTGQ